MLLLFVLILASGFYFYKNHTQNNITDKFVYNNQTDQWEQVKDDKDPIGPDRAEILEKNNNADGLYNPTVLKGYFARYEENTQLPGMRSLLPFTQDLFENVELKLLPNQIIYQPPDSFRNHR